MDLATALNNATETLARAGVDSPRVDAELLAAHVLDVSRGRIQALALLDTDIDAVYQDLIAERASRIPLQHLTGVAHFRSHTLQVGPGVFVPRPETESVVQIGLDWLANQANPAPTVVDLGAGSGAIAVSIALEHPAARVLAVELDPLAHSWAERNVASTAVELHLGDLATAFGELDGQVDLVMSNPPYVPPGAVPRQVEAREHDPEVALYGGGTDGLDVPRAAVASAARLLRPGGLFVMEHAEVQEASAAALMHDGDTWLNVTGHRDLTSRPRATSATRA